MRGTRLRHSSRRRLLHAILAGVVAIPMVGLLIDLLRRERHRQPQADVPIPSDVPPGLSVVGAALVVRTEDGRLRAFSARCSHLGCRIDRVVDGVAVCPCHGSRYRADGSVASGPATRALTPMRVERDAASGGWIARAS